MTPQELADLKTRANYALHHNFHVGMAAHYVAELGGDGVPLPHGVKKNSPAHLLMLIEMVESKGSSMKGSTSASSSAAEVKGTASVKATAASKKKEAVAAAKTEPPPPPPPPASEPQETWDVVLTSAGEAPVALVRELREVLGVDLREIETMISFLPDTVKAGLSQADAESLKARLEKAGATVEVQKSH